MKHILLIALVLLIGSVSLSAQTTPNISELVTPYLPMQSSVTIKGTAFGSSGVTFLPGTVSYGPVGVPVTIYGNNLGSSGTVTFAGVAAAPTTWTTNSITVTVPTGAVTGYVVVTVGGLNSNSLPFIVTKNTYSGSCPLTPPSTQLAITATSLSNGIQNVPYTATFQASGGQAPYSWSLSGGNLPPGLTLIANGVITGTPTTAGSSNFTLLVTDAAFSTVSATFSIGINPATTLRIASLTPSSGGPGTVVVINGSNFGATQADGSVLLFNNSAVSVLQWSDTEIVFAVPTGTASGSMPVTAVVGAYNSSATFTVSLPGCS